MGDDGAGLPGIARGKEVLAFRERAGSAGGEGFLSHGNYGLERGFDLLDVCVGRPRREGLHFPRGRELGRNPARGQVFFRRRGRCRRHGALQPKGPQTYAEQREGCDEYEMLN